MNAAVLGNLDYQKWPVMSENEWKKMTHPKDHKKISVWLQNWLLYGLAHGWITMNDIKMALEVIENG